MADYATNLLAEQHRRLVASVMTMVESSPWWGRLRPDEQRAFRDRMLNAIGQFADLCRDMIKVGHQDVIVNEHALRLIEHIHETTRRLEHSRG